ncbi:MAG TPA: sugar phosphate nucleotidyltransferase [bacterium]|nr:sugar phosphate nucleotidyltransferase [bacterium]
MTTIILCGGSGTRLWPLSRAAKPKQFASIVPGASLFERAVSRNLVLGSGFVIAGNEGQRLLAQAQLADLGVQEYGAMIEPVGRNTAPAIALACMMLPRDEVVLVAPSDHLIGGLDDYRAVVERGTELALAGRLVTFGIAPAYPETGYGYIETDGERVVSFKEKPDAETAKRYVEAGRYYWNSGMFCFKAGVFLDELRRHAPAVYAACVAAYEGATTQKPLRPTVDGMTAIPSISVDYSVMEKSDRVSCVLCPSSLGWSDLGSYDALYDELCPQDASGATIGSPEPLSIDSAGNLVIASGKRIVLVGVEDLVIVDTPDALLVARRGSTQKVKDAVDALKTVEPGLL